MAQTALPAPRTTIPPRRRVFFGLFDADGWSWALAKALFWFIVMILILGYLPDRAYYFTVQRTVDIGLLAWSPINFCPPENETLPCPAPQGATLPWHQAPQELLLPQARTDGSAAVLGQIYVYAGGSDGTKAVADTYLSKTVGSGNFDKWTQGPALPEARSSAATATIGNTLFVIGGYGPDGKPTSTVYSLNVGNDGTVGQWQTVDAAKLPEPRAGASAVTVSDGLVVMGGVDANGAPTRTVWKNGLDATGKAKPWADQAPLVEPNADGLAVHVGEWIYLIGGTNGTAKAVASVQLGDVGKNAPTTDPNAIKDPWKVSAQTNLPVNRTNLAGFTTNAVVYLQGGSDGNAPTADTYWTTPSADGVISTWQTLPQTNLGAGLQGASAIVNGPYAFLIGGAIDKGPTNVPARAYLAPQTPFFQLGILGATVPGLALGGEVGQQIGYMNAALVGTADFILLILIAIALNHRETVAQTIHRLRERRRRRKAEKAAGA
jgi:galactose oxidase-like protein